jgi:hypothetical protein
MAECHGAQANFGHFEAAAAQAAEFHDGVLTTLEAALDQVRPPVYCSRRWSPFPTPSSRWRRRYDFALQDHAFAGATLVTRLDASILFSLRLQAAASY